MLQLRGKRVPVTTYDGNTQFCFGGEMMDDSGLSDADFRGNVLEAHRREPPGLNQLLTGIENSVCGCIHQLSGGVCAFTKGTSASSI